MRVLLLVLTVTCGAAHLPATQLASRPVSEWIKGLESPERIAGLKVDDVVARLQLKPGNVVADLGAGSGIFAVPLARAVGPAGKVYAVEIDADFFPHIERKVKEQSITNVRTILGKPADPGLPAADVDMALLHDVLHHIEDKPGYLRQVVRYLTPAGRLAVVEFDGPKGPHSDVPKLQVAKAEMTAWMAALGLTPSEDVSLFTDKWYVIYARK
jgi:ubiquinone/menaquinone biosynthesis C-methylase UbiE